MTLGMRAVGKGVVEVEFETDVGMGMRLGWRHSATYLPQLRLTGAAVATSTIESVEAVGSATAGFEGGK